ncbi:MAG: DUF362 domain-containing protein [Lentisphaerae bacterium]|nr:DUF362 domain-containing protein [Lentisphaerota bacterium]
MNPSPKVALARASAYGTGLKRTVARLLAEIGGIERFVAPGNKVFIKPNLLTDRTPEEAVTTHPELVRALIQLVRKAGGEPVVGDSPANVVKIERVWDRTGFRGMCREEDVPLINLEKEGSVEFSEDGITFSIAKPVMEADVIINVPKVKTHVLTVLTAGVKNMYGTIPGLQKSILHKLHARPVDFGKLLADVYNKVTPALTVADAITGMEGDGPSNGKSIHLGFLAASADAVSLDLTLCRILGIAYRSVPYLRLLSNGGGVENNRIEVVGEALENVTPATFQVPSTIIAHLIPQPLVRLIEPYLWIRPAVTDACVFCGRCVKACPVDALSQETGEKPVLDPGLCISCCCCHEVCPENAIEMTQSPLLNFVRRGKIP